MATINWMFVEGFLFHRTLSSPFQQNTRFFILFYYFIGWIMPAICVITWTIILQFFSEVSEKLCWEGYRLNNSILIVSVPMIIAVSFNFGFLINIIRILLIKLKADRHSDRSTVKAIKATMFLIPLLGLYREKKLIEIKFICFLQSIKKIIFRYSSFISAL